VILEGILALHDPRVLDMLDLKIFVEADADVCLSRRSESCKCRPICASDGVTSKSFVMYASEAEQSKER
jgi:Phosphoribulokinase / Uridine kinase family